MAYVNLAKGLGAARGRGRVLPGINLLPRRPWRRGVAGFGGRGLGLSLPAQVMVPVPQPGGTFTQEPTAETSLANAAYQDANDYLQFTASSNSPNYSTPAAYTAGMIQYAQTLCMGSGAPYTCFTNSGGSFDPTAMGTQYANVVFAALKATPYGSTNVYDYWIANPVPTSSGYTAPAPVQAYNPASVPGSSVLPTPTVSAPMPTPTTQPVASSPVPAVYVPPSSAVTSTQTAPTSLPVTSSPQAAAASSSASAAALPFISLVDSAGNPNWPLIAGGAALLFGGLYFLGGSR